ncbi:MAG: hypothetical protein M1832_002275 [Thelocarpon impressellum]|nr:MAG: hypothetical protein M1832_002275 [Thelocarpon impressellum]
MRVSGLLCAGTMLAVRALALPSPLEPRAASKNISTECVWTSQPGVRLWRVLPSGWDAGERRYDFVGCGKPIKDNFVPTWNIPSNFYCSDTQHIYFDTAMWIKHEQVEWVLWKASGERAGTNCTWVERMYRTT